MVFSGSTEEEREMVKDDVFRRTGAIFVPSYNHPDIILGQGTLALELEAQVKSAVEANPGLSVHGGGLRTANATAGREDVVDGVGDGMSGAMSGLGVGQGDEFSYPALPEPLPGHLDAVIVPCGGGGLLSGTAAALYGTGTYVFGAEPSFGGADDCRRGLEAGERITTVKSLTIADGLRTPVGGIPWTIISDREKVRGVFAVTEEQIKSALKLVLERMKVVVEPSAVVGLAVALYDEGFRKMVETEGGREGWDVGIIFTGGNVDFGALGSLFAREEGAKGPERQPEDESRLGASGEKPAEDAQGRV